jgi:hypothetical protein
MPNVKRVTYLDESTGGAISNKLEAANKAPFVAAGYTYTLTLIPVGATDFTEGIQRAMQTNPDVIVSDIITGSDAGLFMKQYVALGGKVPVIGLDYTSGAAALAGPAFGTYFYFVAPYFAPHTQWGDLFATNFESQFHYTPNYYNANYYQVVMWYWELVRRVIAAGGDPTKAAAGDTFINELNSNPNFPSLYGNSGPYGMATFDTKTHTLDHALMSFGKGGTHNNPTILATADVTGENFTVV